MRYLAILFGVVAVVAVGVSRAGWPPIQTFPGCDPSGGLHYVCGLHEPEDLVLVPDTRWIIASGLEVGGGGGLFLIDAKAKQVRKLAFGQDIALQPDGATYPGCPSPPDPTTFASHGLNLRARASRQFQLNVVAHGSRESVEVFEVDASHDRPRITWRGCVLLPSGNEANSVTSAEDGSLYATVLMRPGTTFPQMINGQSTGDVYVWHGGPSNFVLIHGLSLAGNNGIEISRDGKTLFVNLTGTDEMVSVALVDPSHPLRRADFGKLGFTPDNVHWTSGGQLIVAGMREDEPTCGRLPQHIALARPKYAECHRGAVVALVDPVTLKTRIIYRAKSASPTYTGTATGLFVGHTLWLSSFDTDRVAYLTLSSGNRQP